VPQPFPNPLATVKIHRHSWRLHEIRFHGFDPEARAVFYCARCRRIVVDPVTPDQSW